MAVEAPFVWGKGGARLTPEQLAQRRAIEERMMSQGIDTSPVGHWTQGMARVAEAIGGSFRRGRLEKAEGENASFNSDLVSRLSAPAAVPAPSDTSAGIPTAAVDTSRAGSTIDFANAGTGDPLRDGIASTAQALGIDPIDLATTISYETAGTFDPTKAGPTTQWGQHRGLIQFGEPQAKQYGVNWEDPIGSQLGPNGAVANYLRDTGVKPGMGLLDIYSAVNAGGVGRYNRSDANNGGAPGTVADKVNNQMAGHRQKAVALFGGSPFAADAPVQVASIDPAAGVAQATTPQAALESMAVGQSMPAPTQTPTPTPVQRVAQAMPAQAAPQSGVAGMNSAMMEALTSPQATDSTRRIAELMYRQQQAQQQAAAEQAYDQQKTAEQRAYERSMTVDERQYTAGREDQRFAVTDEREAARLELERGRFEREGNKRDIISIFDEQTGRDRKGYLDQNGQFVPVGGVEAPKDANGITIGPDGTVHIGGPSKPLTEAQSKDAVFSTRAKGALSILDEYAPALTNRADIAKGAVPFGLGREYQNTEFQLGRQAGDEFLQAILRKDTGAAITEPEQALYGVTYLPQPGDSPELLTQKQQSRARAVAAIEAGMPPSAMVAQEMALRKSAAQPAPAASAPPTQQGQPDRTDAFVQKRFGKSFKDMTLEELKAARQQLEGGRGQ